MLRTRMYRTKNNLQTLEFFAFATSFSAIILAVMCICTCLRVWACRFMLYIGSNFSHSFIWNRFITQHSLGFVVYALNDIAVLNATTFTAYDDTAGFGKSRPLLAFFFSFSFLFQLVYLFIFIYAHLFFLFYDLTVFPVAFLGHHTFDPCRENKNKLSHTILVNCCFLTTSVHSQAR